jgi:hypothetical protein
MNSHQPIVHVHLLLGESIQEDAERVDFHEVVVGNVNTLDGSRNDGPVGCEELNGPTRRNLKSVGWGDQHNLTPGLEEERVGDECPVSHGDLPVVEK